MTLFLDLSDKIKLAKGFDRSTNLELDYQDAKKLRNVFISDKIEAGLLEVAKSVLEENSNQRVRVLSGSPGLGKSTFALFLASVLSKSNPRIIREVLADAETSHAEDLQDTINQFLSSKKTNRLLPVFINGNCGDLPEAFAKAFKTACEREGVEGVYNNAIKKINHGIEIISTWKKQYPVVYRNYKESLSSRKIDANKFEDDLNRGLSTAKQIFSEVYSEVTGNTASFGNAGVIDLFKKVSKTLEEHGYGGIYVIYDEFGKYLEAAINNPSLINLQFLQDFAEYCDRSGNAQCHLLLITHLSVSQYASRLPKQVQQEWAKIEGRFQESAFSDRVSNYYRLITRVFISELKAEASGLFKKVIQQSDEFLKRLAGTDLLPGFADLLNKEDLAKCYPLHPLVLALLPLISQKVAQNERTLYTFLTRNETHSLPEFIALGQTESVPYLMPYDLFLYFEPMIHRDVGVGGAYRTALIMETALKLCGDEDIVCKNILCVIALAEVIKNPRFVSCSEKFLTTCLEGVFEREQIKKALKTLLSKKTLYFNKSLGRYELSEGSAIDLEQELQRYRERKISSKDMVRLLGQYSEVDYLIPNRYNLKHAVTRYLSCHLISVEELKAKQHEIKVEYAEEDGSIYYVIPFNQTELLEAKEVVTHINVPGIFFVLPRQPLNCEKDLEELAALNALYSNKEVLSQGVLIKKELDKHFSVTSEAIKNQLKYLLGKFELNAELYMGDQQGVQITTYTHLVIKIGERLEEVYHAYPVLNSEMLNKHRVSANSTLAKRNLIDLMQKNAALPDLGIAGNPPEKAIYKALCAAVGELKWDMENKIYKLTKSSPLGALRKRYLELTAGDVNGVSYATLEREFIYPPFGVRKAVLPLYVALFDLTIPDKVNHYLDGEYIPNPNGEHYELMQKQPKVTKVHLTVLGQKHLAVLRVYSEVFGAQIDAAVSTIATTIYSWRRSIPDYVKQADAASSQTQKFLIAIDSAKEPDRLLFEKVPAALGVDAFKNFDEFRERLAESANEAKAVYKNLLIRLRNRLEDYADELNFELLEGKAKIQPSKELAQAYKSIIDCLPKEVRNYHFKSETRVFLERIKLFDSSLEKQYFIETMADSMTGTTPRAWNSRMESLFNFSLVQIKDSLVQVVKTLDPNYVGRSFISLASADNKHRIIDLGVRSKLVGKHSEVSKTIEHALAQLDAGERKVVLLNLLTNLDG